MYEKNEEFKRTFTPHSNVFCADPFSMGIQIGMSVAVGAKEGDRIILLQSNFEKDKLYSFRIADEGDGTIREFRAMMNDD